MKKKLLIILGVVAIVLIGAFTIITNGLSEGAQVPLSGIALESVQDGSYTGTYDYKRWTNTLTVQVKDHQITDITIDKDVFAPEITNCSGELFSRVIKEQNTEVDTVSGATVTSKAYLKSIEDALD